MEVGSAFEAVEQQTECTGPDSATQRVVVAYQDVDVDEPGGQVRQTGGDYLHAIGLRPAKVSDRTAVSDYQGVRLGRSAEERLKAFRLLAPPSGDVWTGGIEDSSEGCQPANPSCFAAQLRADNAINTIEPQLVAPASGDFRPVAGGSLFAVPVFDLPEFAGGDLPSSPSTPAGNLSNEAPRDFTGAARSAASPPGAVAIAGGGTGTFALSGRVTNPDGSGRTGVTLTFSIVSGSGALPAAVTTGEGGGWGQTGFTDGVLYRVTPSDAGSTVFAPAFRKVSAGQSAVDFAADGPPPQTYAVSGTVGSGRRCSPTSRYGSRPCRARAVRRHQSLPALEEVGARPVLPPGQHIGSRRCSTGTASSRHHGTSTPRQRESASSRSGFRLVRVSHHGRAMREAP